MSTPEQKSSIDIQDQQVRELAEREAGGELRVYSDPGLSASKPKVWRPEFEQMIVDAVAGKFKTIFLNDLSRFTRLNIIKASKALEPLHDAGVVLWTVKEGRFDLTDPTQLMVVSMLINIYAKEPEALAIRSLDGRKFKVQNNGAAGRITPYGMAKRVTNPSGETFEVPRGEKFRKPKGWPDVILISGDPVEVKIVRWIFTTYNRKDENPYSIAKQLNEKGISSPSGGKWSDHTVKAILTNPIYVGLDHIGFRAIGTHYRMENGKGVRPEPNAPQTQSRKGRIISTKAIHEGIINVKLYNRVQRKIDANEASRSKAKASNGYPFAQIFFCGLCGLSMHGHRTPAGARYRCQSASHKPGGPCKCWGISERDWMPFLLGVISEYVEKSRIEAVSPKTAEPLAPDNGRANRIEKQIATLQSKIKTGQERFLAAPKNLTAGLADTLGQWQAELTELQQQLRHTRVEAEQPVTERLEFWDSYAGRLASVTQEIVPGAKMRIVGVSDGRCKVGDEKNGIVVSDPLVLRNLLRELNVKVTLWWKPRPEGQRPWEIDRCRVQAEVNGRSINIPKVSTKNGNGGQYVTRGSVSITRGA
jgi:DNA invertase Pin-like site-specific DNA recombinase